MQTSCIFCIRQYLMDYYGTSVHAQDIEQEMQSLLSQSLTYFPHPSCSRHYAYYSPAEQVSLDVSKTGPLNTLTVKDINTQADLPYICVSSSRVKANPATPIIVGRGNDYEKNHAILKAKMEVLERICAYYQPRTQFQFGLAENFIEKILPIHASLNSERRWWVKTQIVNQEIDKFIPIEYCQLESTSTVKNPVVKSSSAGMAVHYDSHKAIENGFFEIAEKIAINAIFSHKPRYCFNISTLPEKHKQLLKVIHGLGYKVIILHHHDETRVHGILISLVNRDMQLKKPALVLGSGAHGDITCALEHALLEAYAQLIHALEIYHIKFEKTNHVYDDFLYYFKPENALKLLAHLEVDNLPSRDFDFLEQKNNIIENYPYPILWVDRGNILTDYLRLHVVQVLIPSVYPKLIQPETREVAYEW